MKTIGIIPNLLKDTELEITKHVVDWLIGEGYKTYGSSHIADQVKGLSPCESEEELYINSDILIAIGGDGTILAAAEKASLADVPIIGINLGRLGFLADIEPQDITASLHKLLQENYRIEERMMLRAKIITPGGKEYIFNALNDINIIRGNVSRLTEFEILVNDELCDIYPADGIIVSTPTGSTAYNLSAGGPIVLPHTKAYILTPICPHTIYSKSIILAEEDVVQIKTCNHDNMNMALNIDGNIKMYLTPNHFIQIDKSPYVTRLIKLSELKFFDILRKKIVERRR
ncbi:NAD(+) kinase [Sporanaerobium hydrogeniformans]|uniref:NAD(+) kinase n=1 Tax=Sporanaerobium hydrogeniformans TaxID=3072179 RepID=A0AC61DHU4_9FIRM|nr:NAD(+)/NADH kinase [Sporanaerobium hydrogeniformans]PHV72370.1 NAD(+) kinase [Sporanaerobium hydrogeniformans]